MESGPKGELLPLRLGLETATWIERHKDEPFFAFLSFYSVHSPIQSTEKLWKKYRDKALTKPEPTNRFIMDGRLPVRQVQDNPLYGGMVESMDQAVGIVWKKLDQLNLSDNTIIVFTSDNGGVSAGDGKATSNLPLRGGKGRQWEGGIREPYYIRMPNKQPGTCSVPVTGTDFYPTLLDLCGLELKNEQHVDGASLSSLITGKTDSASAITISKRKLYWHYPHYGNQGGDPSSIVRSGNWKLIWYHENNRYELYNIKEDVGEQSDVSSSNIEVVDELKQELDTWLNQVQARMPTPNENFNDVQFRRERERIRTVRMKNLEKISAKLHAPDYRPAKGWWEETGN